MPTANYVKKISAKVVVGRIVKPEAPTDLFSIIGIARETITGTTQFGDFVGFAGEFEAINAETGEVFKAPKAFIPEPAQGMLAAALTGNEAVEVGLTIGVKPHSGEMGYEYTCRPLFEAQGTDMLADLRERAKMALPAPKKGAE